MSHLLSVSQHLRGVARYLYGDYRSLVLPVAPDDAFSSDALATGATSYVYVVPDHHTAMVDVRVAPDGEDRSRASARYRMTSLSSDADDFVRAFGEAYEREMADWTEAIRRHVVEGVSIAVA